MKSSNHKYYLVAIIKRKLHPLTYKSVTVLHKNHLVLVELGRTKTLGIVVQECEKPDFACKDISLICEASLMPHQMELARFIQKYYLCTLSQAVSLFTPSFCDYTPPKIQTNIELSLSDKQTKALEFTQKNSPALLFGDTGSGKTEIYIKRIAQTISQGKSVLFLMPEISLTPQIQKRLDKHFSSHICLWHSRMSAKNREKTLLDLHHSKINIILGARSALFLPIKNLGLIIVDEEHDESYKSEQVPRYNAQNLAVYLAKMLKIDIILGSATPLAQSFAKFKHFRLKGQYHKAKKELIFAKNIDNELDLMGLDLIKNSLDKKEQAIIFVPTRGNFKYLICKSCSYVQQCPNCHIYMSVHTKKNALLCHYCSHIKPILKECENCGKETLQTSRVGTAQLATALQKIFSTHSIKQFDKDEISTDAKLRKQLAAFNAQKIDVLVGTQMLAHGHDYHNITLAIIVGIDFILYGNDYRSDERAVSLLWQIIGRAGRKKPAKVLIYTNHKEFFSRFANYEDFLSQFLLDRRNLYPPYKKLARLVIENKNEGFCKKFIDDASCHISTYKDVEIVGQGACSITKIKNKFRFFILLRSDSSTQLHRSLQAFVGSRAIIDIDPINFA